MYLSIKITQYRERLSICVDVPSHRDYFQRRIQCWAHLDVTAPETDTATALLKAAVAALSHALVDSDTDQDALITVLADGAV